MIQHLAPLPADYRLDEIRVLTFARFATVKDVNHVTDGITEWAAAYFDAEPAESVAAWQAEVAAHVPTNTPTESQNSNTLLDQAVNVALPRLTQIINAAPAILARTQPTFTNIAGAQAAARTSDADFDLLVAAVRDMALYQRKIIRLIAGQLDGTT